MFKTILVPVDLGEVEAADAAIETATGLAEASGGTVRLIYVRSPAPVAYMEFVPPTFEEEQQGECEQRLGEVAARLTLPSERVSSVVRAGSVYAEVLDEAEKIAADLTVVGSHRPSMATYLLGSSASAIVRHAKSSVLVVRR